MSDIEGIGVINTDAHHNDGYLWCLHCNRVYKSGEFRLKPSQWCAEDTVVFRKCNMPQDIIEMALEPVEMCPYDCCEGDVIGDGIPWLLIREAHPGYPEVPMKGVIYLW